MSCVPEREREGEGVMCEIRYDLCQTTTVVFPQLVAALLTP